MRTMIASRLVLTLCALVLSACPSPSAQQERPPAQPSAQASAQASAQHPSVPASAAGKPDQPASLGEPGAGCLLASDCAGGICEGEGCGPEQPGTCADASRMCTRDYRQYCGCDGKSFGSSGSCPGQRFAHKGSCDSPAATSPAPSLK